MILNKLLITFEKRISKQHKIMKSVISLIVALFIFSIDGFAGTPGNDDVSIIYGLAIGFLALILGIDYLIRFVKKRRLNRHLELSNEEIL